MKNYVLFLISILCTSCLVSRMARPIITGRVLDYQGNPIEKCQVGEVFTDKKGYFRLPEKRYHEFTFIGFEAPPVYVSEEVKKEGYEPDAIVMMSRYGGGNRRGTLWPANDIYLKRIGEKITLKEVLDNTEREVIYTKEGQLMGFLCTDTRDIPTTLRVNDRWKMFDSIKKAVYYQQQRAYYVATKMLFDKGELCFSEYLDDEMIRDTTYYGRYEFLSDSIVQIEMNHPKIKGKYRAEDFDRYFFSLQPIE